MGFSIKRLFKSRETPEPEKVTTIEITDQQVRDAAAEVCLRELAFWTCIGKIANALTKCEFDFTARGVSMPPSLAKGDVQDTSKAVEEMLTFCLDPLAEMLQQEINRKRIGKSGVQKGTRLQINTMRVKHIDMFDIATPADKLISSGIYTVNMLLRALGEPQLSDEWANQHFITKNYSTIQDFLEEQSKKVQLRNVKR